MKQEQFIESVQKLLPGCGREAAQGWVDFAVENVEQEQYVNFKPEPDKEAAAEKWLDTLYAGLSLTKREFGAEITGQICGLSLSQVHCLYPWEMKGAAAYLQNGGDVDKVSELSVAGQFDGDAPFFPTLDNNPYQESNFRITETGNRTFTVLSDSERFGKDAIVFESYNRDKCVDYITERQPAGKWRMYVIPDIKTWATNANPRSPIEYYDTFEAAKARFDELRGQPCNLAHDRNPNNNGRFYAHLTLGIDRVDGFSAADILHVRGGQNYMVDDFTRMDKLNTDVVVLNLLRRTAQEIGFDRVQGFVKLPDGGYKPGPDQPFSEWRNPFFSTEPDRFRYYITNEALQHGSFPLVAGMDVKESIKPMEYENGTVKAFGFIDYPQPLTPEQEREYSLIPSTQNPPVVWGAEWKPVSDEQRKSRLQRQENYLKAAEMGMEQNYDQIDGIINNQEPPRVNQGYTIIDSEIVGHKEFVLAESPTAPQPYVTWARNIQNDEQTGGENFFWGHYFTDPDRARDDLHSRVREEKQDLAEHRPSILSQLKSDAARTDLPTAPEPGRKKDAPER